VGNSIRGSAKVIAAPAVTPSKHYLSYWTIMIAVFMLGLGAPLVSLGIVLIAVPVVALQWRGTLTKHLQITFSLLFVFTLLYFGFTYSKGISTLYEATKAGIFVLSACLLVSFGVGLAVEPAIQGSTAYFAGSCFFLGLVRRLALDLQSRAITANPRPLLALAPNHVHGSFYESTPETANR
jgi:hypothetical protein